MRGFIIPVILFLVPFFYACEKSQRGEERTYGDAIVIPTFVKLDVMNPLLTVSTVSAELLGAVFDGLVRMDEHLEPRPNLALSYEVSKDGLVWTLHLRKGVRFHDGKEFTAEDVKFTLDQARDPQNKGAYSFGFRDVKEAVVRDPYTIEVVLKRPSASFLETLEIGILPKHLNKHPIGTGPFRVSKWSQEEVILEANKDYFSGRPYLDKVIVRVYPTQEAAWAKLIAGEADFFHNITPENFQALSTIPSFTIYSFLRPYYYMIAVNHRHPLFQDRRVRQAMNYAIDKEGLVTKVLKGKGRVSSGTLYPDSWAYDPDLRPYPYNPQKALKLLAEAGWRDTDGDHFLDREGKAFSFTLYHDAGNDLKEKAALFLQDQLLDIGVRMKVEPLSQVDLVVRHLHKKMFDAVLIELAAGGDPDLSYAFWHSSEIKEGLNHFSYKNTRVDKLLTEGRRTFDREKRKVIYRQFQKEISDDPPGIFLFWSDYLAGIHKRFKGIRPSPAGPFAGLRDWYVPKAEQKY